jgi:tetratricopeptide (TPR) repeat protein
MDLYMDNDGLAAVMDLRDEAEEYLVHSLARAGGAKAFESHFDDLGGRVYEAHVLMSLGHLTRSVSLYEEAAECDRLWLDRYPLHPKSLAVAERLVDTYNEWNKPDAARETKLTLAERFLPGSQWYQANGDGDLRAAGRRYAQGAYRETAAHHHRRGREKDEAASWRLALANYERFLGLWPDDADSYRMHFFAGEAAARLDQHSLAADHFVSAAESDSAGLALDASWQRVAVTDAWYRSSRPEGADSAPGDESLATRLLAAGDEFVARFPVTSDASTSRGVSATSPTSTAGTPMPPRDLSC